METFVRSMDNVSRLFAVVAILLLIAGVVIVCQMVFIRYVLNGSTAWQTDFVTYAIMASTFFGCPYVLQQRGHVNVDLLPSMLSEGPKRILALFAHLLSLIFCMLLAYSSYTYFHEALEFGWTTDTVWRLPLWIPLFPLPLGIGLMCLQYVAEMMKIMRGDVL